MKTTGKRTKESSAEKLYALLVEMASGLEKLYGCLRLQQAALLKWAALAVEIAGEDEAEKPSLRQLAESLGGEWPARFEKIAGRIRTASDKVSSMKDQNESIISYSSKLVGDQLKLLLELARLNRNLYEESGKKSAKANMHKVLDQKV